MKIQELIINNFMPYKGEQKVSFPQHETQNVMLLFGDNMRGKTSFLNAIRWGFYGSAVGRHLRPIPRVNLVNIDAADENDWSMSIDLRFTVEGKEYELKRSVQKKEHVSCPRTNADFEEIIALSIDGSRRFGDQVVHDINQVIPEEISRFFLFDGELLQEYENLLIEDSEQGEKIKKHIEQALGVPALIHGKDELSILLKTARHQQSQDAKKSKELKNLAGQQRQLEVKMESSENDLKEMQVQRERIQTQVDDIDDELKSTEVVQRKKVQLEGLEATKESIEKQLVNISEERRQLLQSAWKDVLYSSVNPIIQSLTKKRNTLQNALSQKAVLESKIKDLSKSLNNPLCPTCNQSIPEINQRDIASKLDELQAEAELSEVDINDITSLNNKIDKLSKIRSANESKRIIETISKETKLNIDLVETDSQLDEIYNEIKGFDTDQIMRQRDKREKLSTQLTLIDKDLKATKDNIDENTKSQDHIAKLISKSASGKGELSSIRVGVYQDLEQIFGKGIEYLRDALKEQVASYASKAFKALTTEKTYSGLEINKNYGLSILDHEGRVLKERSAGAEQIVALALIDGLNRTARKGGPIIMDTPLGRLDPKHRSNVLKYLPKMAEQVVLLVHEGEIDPNKDLQNFAERIGARYQIDRISATQSRIVRSN